MHIQAVEDLCIHKMAERLYANLQQQCDVHLGQQLQLLKGHMQLDPVAFLDKADAVWQDYCSQMLTIRSIFLYLDRTFVLSLSGVKSLFDMGLQLLAKHLAAALEVGVAPLRHRLSCGPD